MTTPPRLRVLVFHPRTGPVPATALDSLAGQDLPPECLETVIATEPDPARALNRAAEGAKAEFLAVVPAVARLHSRMLSRCLETLDADPAALAVFPGTTEGRAVRLALPGPFRPAQLLRRNAVGRVFAVRRSTWEELGGLRTGPRLCFWDFWLRLALGSGAPGCIRRLPEVLASCPVGPGLSARDGCREEGRAKALLVAHTPGAFEPDVCRWALALLRGEAWAAPFAPGRIPSPAEVRAMRAEAREAAFASRPLRRSA